MPAQTQVACPIEDSNGRVTGTLTISLLPDAKTPSAGPPLLIEDLEDREAYPVQLLEGAEYRYAIQTVEEVKTLRTDRPTHPDPFRRTVANRRVATAPHSRTEDAPHDRPDELPSDAELGRVGNAKETTT